MTNTELRFKKARMAILPEEILWDSIQHFFENSDEKYLKTVDKIVVEFDWIYKIVSIKAISPEGNVNILNTSSYVNSLSTECKIKSKDIRKLTDILRIACYVTLKYKGRKKIITASIL